MRNTEFLQPDKLSSEPISTQRQNPFKQHLSPQAGLWMLSHAFRWSWPGEGGSSGNHSASRPRFSSFSSQNKSICARTAEECRRVVSAEAAANATQQRAAESRWSMLLSLAQSPEARQARSHPSPQCEPTPRCTQLFALGSRRGTTPPWLCTRHTLAEAFSTLPF